MRCFMRSLICAATLMAFAMPLGAQTPTLPYDHIHLSVPDQAAGVTWYEKNFGGMRFDEAPEVTAIVVQRMDQKSTGAGEEVIAAGAAAVANAVFDAIGVRLRQYPLTPERVRAALNRRA